jgi:cadmium resistance protein CadD (predicted permease)
MSRGVSLAPFAPIAATGFAIAFLHAALPTHWLPFVLVGRAHGWPARKILGVTGMAGAGHVLFTLVLGIALTGAGLALAPHLGRLFNQAVGGLLIALGLFYLLKQLLRPGHVHGDPTARLGARSDAAAVVGLVAVLTFSPCEAFLPLYLANISYGWAGFALLSVVLALGTCLAMILFTSLCLAGADRLRLERLEGYEAVVIGVVLCALGLFVAFEP